MRALFPTYPCHLRKKNKWQAIRYSELQHVAQALRQSPCSQDKNIKYNRFCLLLTIFLHLPQDPRSVRRVGNGDDQTRKRMHLPQAPKWSLWRCIQGEQLACHPPTPQRTVRQQKYCTEPWGHSKRTGWALRRGGQPKAEDQEAGTSLPAGQGYKSRQAVPLEYKV